LVDAVAQCIWIRLRIYLRLGPTDETWHCDYAALPEMAQAPLRLTAREMLDLMFDAEDELQKTPAKV
jgi:hypothetical protein